MASVDMCEHGWPGSGCRECFPKPPVDLNGKAVLVRFRGASNAEDLFDFSVYLKDADGVRGTVAEHV